MRFGVFLGGLAVGLALGVSIGAGVKLALYTALIGCMAAVVFYVRGLRRKPGRTPASR